MLATNYEHNRVISAMIFRKYLKLLGFLLVFMDTLEILANRGFSLSSFDGPWLCIGGFNYFFLYKEKKGGSLYNHVVPIFLLVLLINLVLLTFVSLAINVPGIINVLVKQIYTD